MYLKFAFEKLNAKILFFRSPADLVDKNRIYSVCGFGLRGFSRAYYGTLVSISPLCNPPSIHCTKCLSISYKEENRWVRDSSEANDTELNSILLSELFINVLRGDILSRDQNLHL